MSMSMDMSILKFLKKYYPTYKNKKAIIYSVSRILNLETGESFKGEDFKKDDEYYELIMLPPGHWLVISPGIEGAWFIEFHVVDKQQG